MFIVPAVTGIILNAAVFKNKQALTGNLGLDFLIAILVFIATLFAHEGLHALGFILFGKSGLKDIKFGVAIKQGMVYCTTKKPLTARAYSAALILPFIITGVIPFILSAVLGNIILVLVFSFAVSGAAGDLVMLSHASKLNKDQLILDHPKAPAYYLVYEEGNEPEGFYEVTDGEEAELENEMKASPFKQNANKSWGMKSFRIIIFMMIAVAVLFTIGVILVLIL